MNGRMKARIVLALAVAALLAGCATSSPDAFPDARQALVTVSARNENLGSAYVVPGSQVYVGGKSAGAAMGAVGGLFGTAIGMAIDSERNRATLQGREAVLAVRFDELVARHLRNAGLRVGKPDDAAAHVVVLPAAELVTVDSGTYLICRLEAQYGMRGRTGYDTQRRYAHTVPVPRPLVASGEGWTDNGGAPFRVATEAAFGALAEALAADWAGRFVPAGSAARRVRWQRAGMPQPVEGQLLYEGRDHVVVSGGTPDAPFRSHVNVIERSAVLN